MSTVRTKKTRSKERRRKSRPRVEKYIVTDGEMVLHLEPDESGGYVVTCPFDPALVTEADTLEEAFEMARDAADVLREGRQQLLREAQQAIKATRVSA
jgi:antitoxin HicB